MKRTNTLTSYRISYPLVSVVLIQLYL